ncbi:3'-5' exoribonuclease 1 [Chanos chanos]|uniref:3'-5' exoribonuclease 1 n=1 Tax=Chanos chanos TaxID=29144 RepID=A0A6J2UXE4_CHACN|nr:3'-5' exoribonuclease 1 [Chanos chanos]
MEERKKNIQGHKENSIFSQETNENGTCLGASEETSNAEDPNSRAQTSKGEFSDPVYKEIALANGRVNRMHKDELRSRLAELKLDTRGVKDVLRKRLKNYYKKQKLMQVVEDGGGGDTADTYYDYICVVDFEATCEENNPPEFLHEIIEFPVVLIDTRRLEIVDTFQEYVKPLVNPQLSDFCTKLTGITQKMVDEAHAFPAVLRRVVAWLQEKELGTKYKYALLTDGSWDMSKFLNIQCRLSHIRYPQFARKWINIRKSYGNFYKVPRTQTKLSNMLENLGLQYEGRPHCGLDDSRNIARIALRMLQDGCQLRVNERMHAGLLQGVPSTAPLESAPPPQRPRSRD